MKQKKPTKSKPSPRQSLNNDPNVLEFKNEKSGNISANSATHKKRAFRSRPLTGLEPGRNTADNSAKNSGNSGRLH
jgi:hypothetical protein